MRTAGERVGLMIENDARGKMGRDKVEDKTLAGSRCRQQVGNALLGANGSSICC